MRNLGSLYLRRDHCDWDSFFLEVESFEGPVILCRFHAYSALDLFDREAFESIRSFKLGERRAIKLELEILN